MDPYWLEAWLVDNSNGFHARGLLGALTHMVSRNGPDVVVLNLIGLAVSLAITAVLIAGLYREAATTWSRLAVAVLAASPLCSLFFEEVGDPLTVVFLLFLISLLIIRRITATSSRIFVLVAFCFTAVAVHEASIFLFAPALVLIAFNPQYVGRATFFKYVVIAAPVLLVILLDNAARVPNPDYRAIDSFTGEPIARMEIPFPSYVQLLREEAAIYFATPTRLLQFLLKFPRVWCIPLLGLVLVSGVIGRGESSRTLWRYWLFLIVCSAPLYFIAVDWGRFSTMTFWLAIIATWAHGDAPVGAPATALKLLRAAVPERRPTEGLLLCVTAALILGASAVYPDYGINGMPVASLPVVGPTLIAWAIWRSWSKRSEIPC